MVVVARVLMQDASAKCSQSRKQKGAQTSNHNCCAAIASLPHCPGAPPSLALNFYQRLWYQPGQRRPVHAHPALHAVLQAAMQQQCWDAGQEVGEVEPQQHARLAKQLVELVQQRGDGCPRHLVANLLVERECLVAHGCSSIAAGVESCVGSGDCASPATRCCGGNLRPCGASACAVLPLSVYGHSQFHQTHADEEEAERIPACGAVSAALVSKHPSSRRWPAQNHHAAAAACDGCCCLY